MMPRILFLLLLSCIACKNEKIEAPKVEAPKLGIAVYDKELLSVLDTNVILEVLADGFVWSEGPLWIENMNTLLFTDVPMNTIYSWSQNEGKKIYLQPSGFTSQDSMISTEGANGLALDKDGNLILCQHGDRTVAKMDAPVTKPTATFKPITTQYNGKKYNSPNDIHIASDGSFFFTDPPYGLKGIDSSSYKEMPFNGVYYHATDGTITAIDSSLTKPNGVALNVDESTMYVANSDPNAAIWIKYSLDANKKVVDRSIFADVTHLVPTLKGLPDGLKIHKSGLIFATGPGGVLVFHPDSRHLGTIMTGKATANCAFDTKQEYLYITAHDQLMRIKLK